MLKKVDKDTLKTGADAVIDKAVPEANKEQAKEAAHTAIDKVDIEKLKEAAPAVLDAAKGLMK